MQAIIFLSLSFWQRFLQILSMHGSRDGKLLKVQRIREVDWEANRFAGEVQLTMAGLRGRCSEVDTPMWRSMGELRVIAGVAVALSGRSFEARGLQLEAVKIQTLEVRLVIMLKWRLHAVKIPPNNDLKSIEFRAVSSANQQPKG